MFKFLLGQPEVLSIKNSGYRFISLSMYEKPLKNNNKKYVKKHGLYIEKDAAKYLTVSRNNGFVFVERINNYYANEYDIIVPNNFRKIMVKNSNVKIKSIKDHNLKSITVKNHSNLFVSDDLFADDLLLINENESFIKFQKKVAINNLHISTTDRSSVDFEDDSIINNLQLFLHSSNCFFSENSFVCNINKASIRSDSIAKINGLNNYNVSSSGDNCKLHTALNTYKIKKDAIKIEKGQNEYLNELHSFRNSINVKNHIEEIIKNDEFIKLFASNFLINNNVESNMKFNKIKLKKEISELDSIFNDEFDEIEADLNELENELDDILEELSCPLDEYEFSIFEEHDLFYNDLDDLVDDLEPINNEVEINNNVVLELLDKDFPTDFLNNSNRDDVKNNIVKFIKNKEHLNIDNVKLLKLNKLCFVLDIPLKRNEKNKIAKF